jgi:Holliday junction DNA helicase RuvA
MIHSISGTVKEVKEQAIVVDIGSIGLFLFVPSSIKFHQGQKVNLETYMHWNQEQGPSLFGFEHEFERTVFLLIIGCSGIGPKIALAVLAHLGAQGFLEVVSSGDEKALSKVNGIGSKKAEQIIVQLKHKISQLISSGHGNYDDTKAKTWQEVSQALESLNYTRTEISQAMQYLTAHHAGADLPFDQLLRQALGFLSKRVQ